MLSIEPKDIELKKRHGFLLGGVAPRPIAFVSTLNENGVNNLAPFSFFNAFGANPPTVAFSAARRGRDNTTKHTYENLLATEECVIHAVTYDMVEQVNLASTEYEEEVDEFVKAGFTAIDSDLVTPKRVKESPFQMECKLTEMVELGGGAGSGNLAICEVVKYHVSEDILTDDKIDPYKIDHVGRNGGAFYTRANGSALFELEKPGARRGVGYDGLPEYIKSSEIYTANDIARLALTENIPTAEEAEASFNRLQQETDAEPEMFERQARMGDHKLMMAAALSLNKKGKAKRSHFERTVKKALDNKDLDFAWNAAVYSGTHFK